MGLVNDQGQQLELRDEGPDGYRHYLDDSPVHAGDTLELCKDGTWLRGRYEWNFRHPTPPALYLTEDEGVFLTEDAVLRWPQ